MTITLEDFDVDVGCRIMYILNRHSDLVPLEPAKIARAIFNAAQDEPIRTSAQVFEIYRKPGLNTELIGKDDKETSVNLTKRVIAALDSQTEFICPNNPPSITPHIEDTVLSVLAGAGFSEIAERYKCYMAGKQWIREGLLDPNDFVAGGFDRSWYQELYERNVAWGCETVEGLNSLVGDEKKLVNVVKEWSREYKNQMRQIAADISQRPKIKLVVVCGPSSSGKTTTTSLLMRELVAMGVDRKKIKDMRIDDYFFSTTEYAVDWTGSRDYETSRALDRSQLIKDITSIIAGIPTRPPKYNFKTGKSEKASGEEIQYDKGDIIFWDSHMGNSPNILPRVENLERDEIYVVHIECNNPIHFEGRLVPYTDNRMLRRMFRDVKHRNHKPLNTILHWYRVRNGELREIIPMRNTADAKISGGFPISLACLAAYKEEFFPETDYFDNGKQGQFFTEERIRYERTRELIHAINPVRTFMRKGQLLVPYSLVPPDCIEREFIGGQKGIEIPHND